jgi:hypothetical protein
MKKWKQKLSRFFELIITFGLCDWLREQDHNNVKEFLDKEKHLHNIMYCCGDPTPGSYDERLLIELAERDHIEHPEEYEIHYELLNKEENEKQNF